MLNIFTNLSTESGSKQRFSLLQEKVVIQAVSIKSPVLDLKRGLWIFRKSQTIATASDQYFLSKKTTGGIGLMLLEITSAVSNLQISAQF